MCCIVNMAWLKRGGPLKQASMQVGNQPTTLNPKSCFFLSCPRLLCLLTFSLHSFNITHHCRKVLHAKEINFFARRKRFYLSRLLPTVARSFASRASALLRNHSPSSLLSSSTSTHPTGLEDSSLLCILSGQQSDFPIFDRTTTAYKHQTSRATNTIQGRI